MTATATERTLIAGTLRADRDVIAAGIKPAPSLSALPAGRAQLADDAAAEGRSVRRPNPVFHWG